MHGVAMDHSAAFQVQAQCATGYEGSAVPQVRLRRLYIYVHSSRFLTQLCAAATLAQACTISGEYIHAGCTEIVACASKITNAAMSTGTGYVLQAESDLLANTFDVTAVCDTGYVGTATPVACTANGADYTLVRHNRPGTT
jgi:hypothetical protein